MNICIIPSGELSYESGSTLYATELSEKLLSMGHEVYIICKTKPNFAQLHERCLALPGILSHPVIDDYYVTDQEILKSIFEITLQIINLHKKKKIEIIHAHYGTINSMAAMLANILCDIPYVISCFGRDVFNGAQNDLRYKYMLQTCIQRAKKIICSNDTIANCLHESYKVDRDNLISLPMPVNTELFKPQQDKEIRAPQVYTSIVSSYGTEKGLEVTIQAFHKFFCKQKANCKLLIIGQDEHPERKNWKKISDLILTLHMEKNIIQLGAISHKSIPDILRHTDVLIDSRRVGNYSSVILEGLFSNCVIVASNTDGNREFISHGYNGILYNAGDANELTVALENLRSTCNFSKLRTGVITWCHKYQTKYSLESHVNKICEVYSKAK